LAFDDNPVCLVDPVGLETKKPASSPDLPPEGPKLEAAQKKAALTLAKQHAKSMTQAEAENPRENFKSAKERNFAVGKRAHQLTEAFARSKWADAITLPDQFSSTAGRTQIDVEIPSLRLTVELTSSAAASEFVPRKMQQSLKQLEVAANRGQALAQVFDGDFKLITIQDVRATVANGGWTNEIAKKTPGGAKSGVKGPKGFAVAEVPLAGVGGALGGLMSYTAMKEAELEAEEQESFEPIKDEAARQVGGLAGGIALGEVGAAVGLPGGPWGILAGAALGFLGGALGYGATNLIVEEDTLDPTYQRFCAPN
jgi:hypothetical protein